MFCAIWSKISGSLACLCITDSLSHTTYVETNNASIANLCICEKSEHPILSFLWHTVVLIIATSHYSTANFALTQTHSGFFLKLFKSLQKIHSATKIQVAKNNPIKRNMNSIWRSPSLIPVASTVVSLV